MLNSNIFRLAVLILMTLLSITAFFRLAIVAAIIAGFTGIIIAIAKLKWKPVKESVNGKGKKNFVEGNYTIIEEMDDKDNS